MDRIAGRISLALLVAASPGTALVVSPEEVSTGHHSHHHRHHHHHRSRHIEEDPPSLERHIEEDPPEQPGNPVWEMQKEIEQMALRDERLAQSDETAAAEVAGELEDMEAALATRVGGGDITLANEISSVRGELCADQGYRSHERAECEAFMRKSCIPESGEPADEAHPAIEQLLLPEEVCRHFFLAEEASAGLPVPGPSPAQALAPQPAQYWAPAPGPAPYSALAPGPAAATQRPWFSKSIDALKEGHTHADTKTATSDWGEEFGPNAGHRTYRQICRDHPDNEWCRLHMNYDGDPSHLPSGWQRSHLAQKPGGAARPRGIHVVAALLLLTASLW